VNTEQDLDFSVDSIPESWHEAAVEAPKAERRPLRAAGPVELLPTGISADLATASLAGLAMSIVAGYAWYELATAAGLTSPWVAVGLGVVVAVAVRLGGGAHDPQSRAVLSLLLYLATWSIVMFGISRYLFADLYGSSPSLVEYEQAFLHSRLAEPPAIVAWVAGAVASVKVSYLLRRRQ
jgi:hypothetical protein